MNNDYNNVEYISAVADTIDGVSHYVGKIFKNLKRKK